MHLKSSIAPPTFLLLSFLLFSSATAFNITQLLAQYSDFSTFNGYLTDTQLAADINKRQSITILAVDNGGLSPLSGKPKDVIKKVVSLHVVLDYFDVPKLQKLPNNTATLPTLFQASGESTGQQGFLNVTHLSTGGVVFGSAVHGTTLGANLVKSITSQPYNISVLQISTVIIPSGLDNSSTSPSPSPPPRPPPPSSAPAPGPSPSNKSLAPAPTPAKTPSPPPPGKATPPSPPPPVKASPPSPTRPMPSRPPLGPVPAKAPAIPGRPIADGPTPVGSPRGSPPGDDDSSAPATVGIHLAVVIMLVSSLLSFT